MKQLLKGNKIKIGDVSCEVLDAAIGNARITLAYDGDTIPIQERLSLGKAEYRVTSCGKGQLTLAELGHRPEPYGPTSGSGQVEAKGAAKAKSEAAGKPEAAAPKE